MPSTSSLCFLSVSGKMSDSKSSMLLILSMTLSITMSLLSIWHLMNYVQFKIVFTKNTKENTQSFHDMSRVASPRSVTPMRFMFSIAMPSISNVIAFVKLHVQLPSDFIEGAVLRDVLQLLRTNICHARLQSTFNIIKNLIKRPYNRNILLSTFSC